MNKLCAQEQKEIVPEIFKAGIVNITKQTQTRTSNIIETERARETMRERKFDEFPMARLLRVL